MHCEICCHNNWFYKFNDENYTKPLKNTIFHKMMKITGYNWIINPNSYNECLVCNQCLLEKIYNCNLIQKYDLLQNLHIYIILKKIITKNNLPSELTKIIYKYMD